MKQTVEGETGTRRCFVTGETKPKEKLVRFVIGPGDEVVPDISERLPGRGLWLSAARDVLNKASAKNLFAKAARQRAVVPDDLADRVEALLAARCVDLIGLARRASGVTAGYEKVRAKLKSGKAGLLLAASDGADGGKAKIAALAPDMRVIDVLSGAELGAAIGREAVVHMVLAPGRLANRLLVQAERLAGFRNETDKD